MKHLSKPILIAVALASSVPAFASNAIKVFDGPSAKHTSNSGFYGGASIGQAFFDNCQREESSTGNIDCKNSSDENAWKIFGGYKVMPNVGFEGAYIDFGQPTAEFSDGTSTVTGVGEATGFSLAAVGSAPVADSLELFGKLGVARWELDTYNASSPNEKVIYEGSGLLIGAGANVNINQNVGIRGEIEHFDDLDINLLTIGGTFSSY